MFFSGDLGQLLILFQSTNSRSARVRSQWRQNESAWATEYCSSSASLAGDSPCASIRTKKTASCCRTKLVFWSPKDLTPAKISIPITRDASKLPCAIENTLRSADSWISPGGPAAKCLRIRIPRQTLWRYYIETIRTDQSWFFLLRSSLLASSRRSCM